MKRLLLGLFSFAFVAGPAGSVRADGVVTFNEIMYHPATNEPAMEWVELHNQLAVDVDISGWSLSGGIQYTFASNTIIRGRSHVVVAVNPGALMAATGLPGVLGPFAGRLGNDGDTVRLRNNSGRVLDEFTYGVEGDWPVGADGSGVSLAKRDPDTASDPASSWTLSGQMGGTPGARNFTQTTGFVPPPGLVSYWNFNEASGVTAIDQAGQNHGALGGGVSRVSSSVGRALSFNGMSNAFVNAGAGGSFSVSSGITIEAMLTPGWSTTNTAVIFRKAPRRPAPYRDTILAQNPIAYWRLGGATTAIADSSPNNRAGTATAGVLLNQPSLVPSDPGNTAARFTGTERITVNGFEKIGAAGYTVEFWVRPHALPTGCCQNLVGDGEAAGDYFMMNYIIGPQQGLTGAIRPHYGPANSPVSLTGPTALQVNNTYHIVTTWDTSLAANNAVIYINGAIDSVGTITRNVPAAGTTGANRVYIGKDDRDTTDGTETIDEVALYNRPLSGTEVSAHYAAGVTVNFDLSQGNAIQLALQDDGNNAAANPPVAPGPVLSFGLTVAGAYSELDLPLDGQSGRPTLTGLEDGQPHHVAATYNPVSGLKAIYVDGVLRFSTTLSGALNANNGASAILGNSETNGTAPFVGTLDEMAFWGRALTASEVAAHAAAVQAGRDYFTPAAMSTPATLAFNELSASTNAEFWLELINYGGTAIPLAGHVIVRDGVANNEYVFPAGPALAGAGLLAVTNNTLGFHPVDGDKLYLLTPARDRVLDAVVLKKGPRARWPAATGPFLRPSAPSPGGANTFAFHDEIVINEIMYHHQLLPPTNNLTSRESPGQWIELFNKSSNTVNLTGWELDGGIRYVFTPGQTVAPGGYLVVADDVAYLRSLYPSIQIVGDYSGRLSGRSDLIVLKDAAGNPADVVRYFDGGRWPSYADGDGSSLELCDPDLDNSKGEAWAASDESGKTSWQTYTYRLAANIPSGSGQPGTWQDFILGLQAAGECLIDDISVTENPATTPAAVIANGDFESGLSGWRTLGTHVRSRVVEEPGNPGNHVLRLIASGPQEHMHNHIERTLIAGKTIVAGREYQISFRARWLAGNNLLNTRLYFNRCARTTTLPTAQLNGTPGAPNQDHGCQGIPTFDALRHQPVIPQPGEPVTVSVTATAPGGLPACSLYYSVNGGASNVAAMTHIGEGRFAGTIPAQSAGAIVQFWVLGDRNGADAWHPAAGPSSGALYIVNDGQANLPLAHNVRIILSPANVNLLHGTAQGVNQTNVMSNDLLPCTVIYDEARAYYDCGVHLRGSQRGRYSDVRTGFHIEFPPDDPFRGVHPVMLIDRSGAGDATGNRQEEIVLKHILNRAGGIPGTYSEICRLLAPRSAHTGAAQFFPRHEDLFIETAFENGGDGQMFEMELIYYPTSANAAGYKNPQPDSVIGTDITDLGGDEEIYRYNFMIKNHRDADDYRRFITLAKAWSLSGATLDAQTRQLMDIDQWMRAYALISLCSVGDMYTFGNNHNFFMYVRPSDGKFLYFPWDMDFAFTRGSSGGLVGDQNLGRIVTLPGDLRCLYAHMLDIIGISFNSSYMAYWTDHYDNFAPGQNYAGSLSTIGARATFVQNTINSAGGNSNFLVSGSTTLNTSSNLITLTGTAPVRVKTIKINGREYAVTWTSVSTWVLRLPLSDPVNVLNVEAYDLAENIISNLTRTITVNYTGPALPDPAGLIVFNEIMYNPAFPDGAFVELFNTSSNVSFDLSGWRINGLDFTFPPGSLITNRQYLVVASSMASYVAAYGTNAPVPSAQFAGNLQNDGETLTLLRPGPNPGEEIEVDQVRYESAPPWPINANGTGPSLQLIDASQDNSRVGNWAAGATWTKVTRTGSIASATNLMFWHETPGAVFIDDISLVGPAGTNLAINGDFESGVVAPFLLGTNYAASAIVTGVSHSGSRSLLLVGGVPVTGSTIGANVNQAIGPVETNATYTLTYYILFHTNPVRVAMRTLLGANLTSSGTTAPTVSTPGLANTFAETRPAFLPLWLNEAQPENLTGILDNQNEREPWVEIYNAGTTAVSLAGCYLSSGYANLTQWPFPPGAMLQPGEFKVVFCDNEPDETTAGEWHASFDLSPGAGSVALVWSPGAPQVLDYLNYTNIPPDRSYGDYPDGQPFHRQEFYRVTAGSSNDNTAAPLVVFINEWMAANTRTLLNTNNGNRYDDWFELYNPGNSPADLGGYFLTDNLSNKFQFPIPHGFEIPPHGFKLVWADGASGLNDTNNPDLHVNFALAQAGEQIGLFGGDGTLIDAVIFEPQFNDFSQGRFPDGPTTNYFLATPTPRASNTLWANRYPTLDPIPDATAYPDVPFAFNAVASDPDAPPQMVAYSLDGLPPSGAGIDASTGVFTWTPTALQTPGTNLLTVRVIDNGVPALSATRNFTVIVRVPLLLTGVTRTPGGDISFSVGTIVGRTYRVEFKDDLNEQDWTPLRPAEVAMSTSLTVTDNIGTRPQRFYQVVLVD